MRLKGTIVIFILFQLAAFSQVKKTSLNGKWITVNDNNSFKKKDTIRFYKDSEFTNTSSSCNIIIWKIQYRKFKTNKLLLCSEPCLKSEYDEKEKIRLIKTDFGQVLKVYLDNKLVDKFRIITKNNKRYLDGKKNIKQLNLMRYDKLSDEKLYKYVDSLITKVLKYNPNSGNNNNEVKISNSNTNVRIRIRNRNEQNLKPLLVINGFPIDNINILKDLLLVETYSIKYLTKEKSVRIFGYRAVNGVIILNTSKKRFKRIRKKYRKEQANTHKT